MFTMKIDAPTSKNRWGSNFFCLYAESKKEKEIRKLEGNEKSKLWCLLLTYSRLRVKRCLGCEKVETEVGAESRFQRARMGREILKERERVKEQKGCSRENYERWGKVRQIVRIKA